MTLQNGLKQFLNKRVSFAAQQYFLSETKIKLHSGPRRLQHFSEESAFFHGGWEAQKALCEWASVGPSAGKANVSLEADNVAQALVNSPGLPGTQTAFPHAATP